MQQELNILPLSSWGLDLQGNPLIIAGPCSAESEDQMLETARKLASHKIPIFRAGIWKPRTRPGCFEGVGCIGLSWMQKVKEETGMLTTTEVANRSHVKAALDAGIDILWIGARTTVNPFAVQEIAEALKGVDIPVMIKNPVNPDPELWLGAIERVNKAGIRKIAAIHRGFSDISETSFRNAPKWQIPIELKRRAANLPIICDPSHISGRREAIRALSQKAMDLNLSGLMIESHINPDKALSDKDQQVTPDFLKTIIDSLVLRDEHATGQEFAVRLSELRARIDETDTQILDLLEKRMAISGQIGELKKKNNVAVLQTERWDEILSNYIERGAEKGFDPAFTKKIFKAIHQASINIQSDLMNPGTDNASEK